MAEAMLVTLEEVQLLNLNWRGGLIIALTGHTCGWGAHTPWSWRAAGHRHYARKAWLFKNLNANTCMGAWVLGCLCEWASPQANSPEALATWAAECMLHLWVAHTHLLPPVCHHPKQLLPHRLYLQLGNHPWLSCMPSRREWITARGRRLQSSAMGEVVAEDGRVDK